METKRGCMVLLYFTLFYFLAYFCINIFFESPWDWVMNPFFLSFLIAISLTFVIFLLVHEIDFLGSRITNRVEDSVISEMRMIRKEIALISEKVIKFEKCMNKINRRDNPKKRGKKKK